MKRILLLIAVLMLAVAACDNLPSGVVEPTPSGGGETSEAITDAITATEPAPEPGVIVVEPVDTGAPAAGALTAAVDASGLAAEAAVQVVPATPYDGSQPASPVGLPEHIRIEFTDGGQPLAAGALGPVMYVIPVDEYTALWEAAGDQGVTGTLAGLRSLVEERFEPFPDAGIPVLPVEEVGSAYNDLAVQGKYLAENGITGLRFVGRFVEASSPVTNEGLTYVFQGFTDDGAYYISFFYPVSSGVLPVDLESASATELELFNADTESYLAERVTALNQLAEADWTPDLAALDALVLSLQIPGPEVGDIVTVEGTPLVGTTWQWASTIGPTSETAVADPTRYSLTFNDDGTAALQADCNQVLATYAVTAEGGITFTFGPSTLAACPPDSQDQQFLAELGAARFYFVEAGTLSIEVAEDGTTMRFNAPGEVAQGLAPEASGDIFLTTGEWHWTDTSDPLGIRPVDNPAQYTIRFNPDGTAAIQADCNSVMATYSADATGSMSIQLGPSTLAACGPESRDAEFLSGLEAVVTFFGQGDDFPVDDGLTLEMMADGGALNFVRVVDEAVTAPGVPVAPEVEPVDLALVGPVWQWTVLRQINGETAVPEPARYTVVFNSDGTATIQADCNTIGATYVTGADGAITITPGPSTLAFCGEGSLDQVFAGGLSAAQSYAVANGALEITLQLENGTMIFVPTN